MKPRIGDLAIANFDKYKDVDLGKVLCIITGYRKGLSVSTEERWAQLIYWKLIDEDFCIHSEEILENHLVRVYPKHHVWHGSLRELTLDDVTEYKD